MMAYELTFSHTLFAAPYMPPVHSSFNPLKAGPWLKMTSWLKGLRDQPISGYELPADASLLI